MSNRELCADEGEQPITPVEEYEKNGDERREQRWIEADSLKKDTDDGDGDSDPDVSTDLFADPDPYDQFDFIYTTAQGKEIRITLHGYKAELGQTLNSTGLTLWRASEILCEYLIANMNQIQDKRVLELGAGLGMCGILVHNLGASKVILTDGDTDTLAQQRQNVEKNCINNKKLTNISNEVQQHDIVCRQLIWGENLDEFVETCGSEWDVIIGSDIIYVEEIINPLWRTVQRLLSQEGVFYLAYARRNVSIDLVFDEATKHGFVWESPKEVEGVFVFRREV